MYNFLAKLDTKKAPGYDGMSAKMLKMTSLIYKSLSVILTNVVVQCFS